MRRGPLTWCFVVLGPGVEPARLSGLEERLRGCSVVVVIAPLSKLRAVERLAAGRGWLVLAADTGSPAPVLLATAAAMGALGESMVRGDRVYVYGVGVSLPVLAGVWAYTGRFLAERRAFLDGEDVTEKLTEYTEHLLIEKRGWMEAVERLSTSPELGLYIYEELLEGPKPFSTIAFSVWNRWLAEEPPGLPWETRDRLRRVYETLAALARIGAIRALPGIRVKTEPTRKMHKTREQRVYTLRL